MVKHLNYLFCLLPLALIAGEFTASVNHNPVNLGDSFILNLTLSGTSAKAAPSLDVLSHAFTIHSQQQFLNTVVNNGQMSSTTSWKVALLPKSEGEFEIPALSIDSAEGPLVTQPIKIQVVKGAVDPSEANDIVLTSEVSNAEPYKNEPVIYTVKLVSKKDIANLDMQKISIENAIVEQRGDPVIYKKMVDGVSAGVIEYHYLITPLKAGPLKIPALVLQGVTPVKRRVRQADYDPFVQMMGFGRVEPFAVTTQEMAIEVQPPVEGINPWIPARSIKIEESWNPPATLQVGEPITRGFTISGEGVKAAQLPSLSELQKTDNHFKIYADKPDMKDGSSQEGLVSQRIEQYTLIPQQAGDLTLPELSITWWDVNKKQAIVTRIPARKLHVLPAPVKPAQTLTPVPQDTPAPVIVESKTTNPVLYVALAALTALLAVAILWGLALQRKVAKLQQAIANKNPDRFKPKDKQEKLPDLNPT